MRCREKADQGDPDVQYVLGTKYAFGEGVPRDYVEAYKWYNLAAASGQKQAAEYRRLLESKMTPAQIAEAQRLSREFKPQKTPASGRN